MAININPALGRDLAETLVKLGDKTILETVQNGYEAIGAMGDNHVTDELKQKFKTLEQRYNDELLPTLRNFATLLGEESDFAEYFNKLQTEQNVSSTDAGQIQTGQFNPATAL